ncbi:MAG: HAD superfamily hydrolase [Microgenomates group bacterium GW2011_GWA2_46_7]|nr:MAG: HAD superfamily hydrolase [Microgenomates group bacterium GW2011_GWC2_46_7]KKU47021.1 MAG: HAD superfamily hydrolase [Microgenomates group bacterium GW2011_GWA2_46_7]
MQAILFDLNGVLILDKPGYQSSQFERDFFKRMGMSLDDTKEKELIKREQDWDEQQFWNFVDQGWRGALPNLELVQIIKKLKRNRFKTAIVSNTSGLIMRQRLADYFGEKINTLFDEIVISSEVGLLKPDPKIYQLVLDRLGVLPSNSIMVDDSDQYLKGAQAIGIRCFQYYDNLSLTQYLQGLLTP